MKTDLLVLGAGPAGFAISYLMAQKGYSVEVLDSAFFPRTKICGEFLNPQAVQWLQEQELLSSLLKLVPFPVHGMKITDRNGVSFTGHYTPPGLKTGYAILRKDFDALLVTKGCEAGVSIREGYRAERLILEGDDVVGVCGRTASEERFEKRAAIVVGADGRNNLVGRTFGWMKNLRNLRKYAFLTYFENVPDLSNFGEIHLVNDGYIGIAPLSDSLANVALVIDERACPAQTTDLVSFLLSRLHNSLLRTRFERLTPVAPVISAGPLAFEMKRTSGYRTILVGDTCGFIDPFTGEGINYAFVSANIAAEVLHRSFRLHKFDNDDLMHYDRERRRMLGRKFQIAKLVQKAIEWPRLSSFLVKRFGQSLQSGDMIVSAVGSAIPVEQVWNLRFLLKVAFGVKN